jgi:hypothetical protein
MRQEVDLSALKAVVAEKLKENEGWYTIDDQYQTLQEQVETDLKPMLWTTTLSFNLQEMYEFVVSFKV